MEYEAGDVIWYQPFGGGLRRVIVEERLADVKRGRAGFDGIVVSGPEKGMAVWGYDDQIVPLRPVRNDGCPDEPVGHTDRQRRAGAAVPSAGLDA